MSKILVVDDDQGVTLLLKRIISKKGHQIYTAANGWEGFNLAQTIQPDLIFTDVRMPDISGEDLSVLLKADPFLRHVPVIILSGTAYLLDRHNIAADDILSKPFDLVTVYSLLDRYLADPVNSGK